MDDKLLMESLLNETKGACDLYLHGTIESATPNVHSVMDATLKDTLTMQSDIYSKMAQKGWYPSETAEQHCIDKARQQYASGAQ